MHTWMSAEAHGLVDSFDEPRGLGTVRCDDGAVLPFHCTAIADGSRAVCGQSSAR